MGARGPLRGVALSWALLVAVAVSAQAEPFAPDEIVVRFKPGVTEKERAKVHAQNNGEVEGKVVALNTDVVDIPDDETISVAIEEYSEDPEVMFAEPNITYSIEALPSDEYFFGNTLTSLDLWGLQNSGQARGVADADIDAPEAWDLLPSWSASSDVRVAVIDTGAQTTHPDLLGNVLTPCYTATSGKAKLVTGCEDDNGHGTHVAGTVAASANNGGVVGVAPGAGLYICKALNAKGSGFSSDIAACINQAAKDAAQYNIRVISMSFGGTTSKLIRTAADAAAAKGVLLVAAAGNGGSDKLSYPAAYESVVSVGATDRSDNLAAFSQRNSDVELSAPGVGIVSTHLNGAYKSLSGTSMATPMVAGVAGLIAARTGKSGFELRTALDAAVDDLGDAGRDSLFGFGRVNLCKALGGNCLYRNPSNTAPVAALSVSSEKVQPGESMQLDASRSVDGDGRITSYSWDLDGNGRADALGSGVKTTSFSKAGNYGVSVTVTDDNGATTKVKKVISVKAPVAPRPESQPAPAAAPAPVAAVPQTQSQPEVKPTKKEDFIEPVTWGKKNSSRQKSDSGSDDGNGRDKGSSRRGDRDSSSERGSGGGSKGDGSKSGSRKGKKSKKKKSRSKKARSRR